MKNDPYFKFITLIVLSGVALSFVKLDRANVTGTLSKIAATTPTVTLQRTTSIAEVPAETPVPTAKPQPRHRRQANPVS